MRYCAADIVALLLLRRQSAGRFLWRFDGGNSYLSALWEARAGHGHRGVFRYAGMPALPFASAGFDASRILGAFLALAVGALVWRLTHTLPGLLDWVMPELYAILAYSFTFAIFLMATADLSMRHVEAAPEPLAASSHGHTPHAGHH